MLANLLARQGRPVRYAHTPETLEALSHYLRFATRLLGVPEDLRQAGPILRPIHAQQRPPARQAYRAFRDTGHPADLAAYLDILHGEHDIQQPVPQLYGRGPGLGWQIPDELLARLRAAEHGSGDRAAAGLNLFLNHLHTLHQSDRNAQENPFHVGRQFTPEFLKDVRSLPRGYNLQTALNYHTPMGEPRDLRSLPYLVDRFGSPYLSHMGDAMQEAVRRAREARLASGQ